MLHVTMQHSKNTLVNMWILQLANCLQRSRSSMAAGGARPDVTEERFRIMLTQQDQIYSTPSGAWGAAAVHAACYINILLIIRSPRG